MNAKQKENNQRNINRLIELRSELNCLEELKEIMSVKGDAIAKEIEDYENKILV